jgi:UDP-N-acetylmuramate-alanine ligase
LAPTNTQVGADVPQFPERSGAAVGSDASPHFVLEADEYDGAFLQVSVTKRCQGVL